MFNYGSFKLFLTKVFFGVFLTALSSFLIISLLTYNPNDPGIGKLGGTNEILNFFGFWGAISSSLFFIFFGRMSFVIFLFISYVGISLSLGLLSRGLLI